MDRAKIVLLCETKSQYADSLSRKYDVTRVRTGRQAIEYIDANPINLVVVDSLALTTTGERICGAIKRAYPSLAIFHILPADQPSATSPADYLLLLPLTTRRLNHVIERHLKPIIQKLITCGPFAFDPEARILIAHGTEKALTPKQAALVQLFLKHPNQTLERSWLMREIWDTDYLGDTRTLDVHIRLLRQVLENESEPHFLKTVRGVGYRLEIPD